MFIAIFLLILVAWLLVHSSYTRKILSTMIIIPITLFLVWGMVVKFNQAHEKHVLQVRSDCPTVTQYGPCADYSDLVAK